MRIESGALIKENLKLRQLVQALESCIRKVANELPHAGCGGVDGDQNDPNSTTQALLAAIRKLKAAVDAAR